VLAPGQRLPLVLTLVLAQPLRRRLPLPLPQQLPMRAMVGRSPLPLPWGRQPWPCGGWGAWVVRGGTATQTGVSWLCHGCDTALNGWHRLGTGVSQILLPRVAVVAITAPDMGR